ncbi:MAG: hypothetical protein WBH86_13910 [Thermogutta sp.]|nr:hypothetical protein [Thermogutta sp.]HOP77550.1 hypothetical protein [Thermogutta sp.]HPU05840.1 hypothetical protein [Thermogutta sp.]HPZ82738.1 hypothetical protein [Thermogutta sp.]HQF12333.1 hypothetical protein [Thermogutta sp.]
MTSSHDPDKPSSSRGWPQVLGRLFLYARSVGSNLHTHAEAIGPLANGMGLALVIGGAIWLLASRHPLALAMVFLGTALYLATRFPGGPEKPSPPAGKQPKPRQG